MDRGAWQATVNGVAESTRLKRRIGAERKELRGPGRAGGVACRVGGP